MNLRWWWWCDGDGDDGDGDDGGDDEPDVYGQQGNEGGYQKQAALHVTRHTSHVTRNTSHVTRHTSQSHVTRHTSHIPVTRHLQQPLKRGMRQMHRGPVSEGNGVREKGK